MTEEWKDKSRSKLKEQLQDVLLKFRKLVEEQVKSEQEKIERLKQMAMKK